MSCFILISLALSPIPQDRAIPYSAEVYSPPVVRPFEPPSNFGRVTAEGDGGGDPRRRPIVAPVVVEAYSRSYEHSPSTADTAYDRGVANAEAAMDARMGPLDGLWRVSDDAGRALFHIAVKDPGGQGPVEGAYREADDAGSLGPLVYLERTPAGVRFSLNDAVLEVSQSAEGWRGVLRRGGERRSVILSR